MSLLNHCACYLSNKDPAATLLVSQIMNRSGHTTIGGQQLNVVGKLFNSNTGESS